MCWNLCTFRFVALIAVAAALSFNAAARSEDAKLSGAVRIELRAADGSLVASQTDSAAATLTLERNYADGDRIVVTGPQHLVVRLDETMPECIVFSPQGRFEYPIPQGQGRLSSRRVYSPKSFQGGRHVITARPATAQELASNRNVAINAYDVRGDSTFFPHATSNSECRGEPDFAARNAVDGSVLNTRHGGWPYQSWGPDKRKDLWWKVEFGRAVEVDRLDLVIRADFPHDRHWHSATIEFSDGSRETIQIAKTADQQKFSFKKRTATWLRLTDLVQAEPLGWCALVEVLIWGHDAANR